MDIKQIPGEVSRAAYQLLTTSEEFDNFILELLWQRSPLAVKEVVAGSRRWFAKTQIFPGWEVPILMIHYSGHALIAHHTRHDHLLALAEILKATARVDYLQIMGSDLCLRYWFDVSQGVWMGQNIPLPSDWEA